MPIKVCELFAGVGGFRIGLEGAPDANSNPSYKVVWSNQWEPGVKNQHASDVYVKQWNLKETDNPVVFNSEDGSETHVNDDIAEIDLGDIPEHDLLVGGFPCQDYSVAKTANKATGLEGKKGVLWWEIHRIMKDKRPPVALLENVDRLLKSPTSQRGRDFAIMLASLDELGYVVEWRVINAAEYGMPQRRRRVFILAYAPGTPAHAKLIKQDNVLSWIQKDGNLANAFPIQPFSVLMAIPSPLRKKADDNLADISDGFNKGADSKAKSPFKEAGVMTAGQYYTYRVKPAYSGDHVTMGDILIANRKVPLNYCLEPESVLKEKGWHYLKNGKKEERKGTDGFTYMYNEGPVAFPDPLDKPSRTIITGEGGKSASRFKHVVKFRPTKKMREEFDLDGKVATEVRNEMNLKKSEWLRRLTPIELERLNMFPDDHTAGPTEGNRAFFMGNALVVGIIEKIGEVLIPQFKTNDGEPEPPVSEDNFFIEKARELLELFKNPQLGNRLIIYNSPLHGEFGCELRRYSEIDGKIEYKGTQADPKKKKARRKQGLFDFLVITGDKDKSRYLSPKMKKPKKATHKDLFEDLLLHSSVENSLKVWSGENPADVGTSDDEKEVLFTMFLMMLEQEINWGEMGWQKRTNFWPGINQDSPPDCRPRDMIMGFVRQAFILGMDRLESDMKYWMFNYGKPPTTSDFTNSDDNCRGWSQYVHTNPEEARLFTELSEKFDTVRVMDNGVEIEFSEEASNHPDNQHWTNQQGG